MTRIRISALKVLVLTGFCALVSLVPSVRAAGPFAIPECATPAEGCVTGIGMKTFTTMDVSYCEHDPGHNPVYWIDYYWPTTPEANPCPPGEVFNIHCIEPLDAAWVDLLTAIDTTWRKAVCACWEQHPGDDAADVAARNECLHQADLNYANELYDTQKAWKRRAAGCCGAYPRPALIIPEHLPKTLDDFSKRMIRISNN